MEWFQAALHWNVTNVIPSSGTWHFAGSLKEHAEGCRVPAAGGHPPTELVQNKPTFQRYTSVVTTGAVTALRRRCLGFPVTFHCTEVPSSAGVWVLWVPCSQLLSTACCQPQCTLQQGLGLVPHAAPCRATAAYPSMWCHGLVMSLGSCKDHIQAGSTGSLLQTCLFSKKWWPRPQDKMYGNATCAQGIPQVVLLCLMPREIKSICRLYCGASRWIFSALMFSDSNPRFVTTRMSCSSLPCWSCN